MPQHQLRHTTVMMMFKLVLSQETVNQKNRNAEQAAALLCLTTVVSYLPESR
jgi:hypothetical protein